MAADRVANHIAGGVADMEVKQVAWPIVRSKLGPLAGDDAPNFARMVAGRRASAMVAQSERVDCCWLEWVSGRTLVIACLNGSGLKEVAEYIHARAVRARLTEIRFHTTHKGLSRLVRQAGFDTEPVESVFRVKV